jgi:hypothetical protein
MSSSPLRRGHQRGRAFLQDGSTVDLLPAVSQTIDWVRLPNRFPVRIHVTGTPPGPCASGKRSPLLFKAVEWKGFRLLARQRRRFSAPSRLDGAGSRLLSHGNHSTTAGKRFNASPRTRAGSSRPIALNIVCFIGSRRLAGLLFGLTSGSYRGGRVHSKVSRFDDAIQFVVGALWERAALCSAVFVQPFGRRRRSLSTRSTLS